LLILAQMGEDELNHLLAAQEQEEQDILALIVAALDAGDTARAEEIAASSGTDADGIREFIVMYQQCAAEAEAEAEAVTA
jgi:myo-inositol catabolism protein IolC